MRRQRGEYAKPDLVSQTLVYPVTETTESLSTSGFNLTVNQFADIGQAAIEVQLSGGTPIVRVPPDGGLQVIGVRLKCWPFSGSSYVALCGDQTYPYIELADGTGQGSRVWSGRAVPGSTTVGTARAGDYYLREQQLDAATLLAASATTTNGQGSLAVGTGTLSTSNTTKLLDGTPAAGDLLVVAVTNGEASGTLAVTGGDSGITATGADGGVTANDGTRYVRMFSRVVQAGDISGGQIVVTPSAHGTLAGRRISAWVFRHASGTWTPTGSKNGCALHATASHTGLSTNQIVSVTGPTAASSIAVTTYVGTSGTSEAYWDGGDATTKTPDHNDGTSMTAVKPGLGTNTSGVPGYSAGGSSVVWGGNAANSHSIVLAQWAVSGAAAGSGTIYVCTTGGTPGTWSQVL